MSLNMAETTQYTFPLTEVTEALIKAQGIDSGVWDIAIEFALTAGLMGPTPEGALPTALLQVNKVLLIKHADDQPFNHTTVDAAATATKQPAKRSKKI
jgi:hypothetical protein